ncbi:MAG: hypothetical protein CSA50_08620 [Gammaproteobacteria bacterium]|nr:MAG: hypothetical protein CSA50_08620 [Gammaproteobacteria bacterium]
MVTRAHRISILRLISCLLLTGFLTGFATSSKSGELKVSVDKDRVYLNETFELRINGETDFEFSFGSLLNFNSLDIPEPDITDLRKGFDIMNRQQQYTIRSINGQNKAVITWIYELSPRAVGTTEIPALSFKDQVSKPIPITVLASRQATSDEPPLVFVETELDKTEAYVQEQIMLTVRLYHLNARPSGELESPEFDNAIVEQLGKDVDTYRMRYNQRYNVIERKYVIFPQKSGKLDIPALSFKGRILDTRHRKRRYTTQTSQPGFVTIKPVPSQFSGTTWLPALAVELTENWSNPVDNLKQGDSVTRTIELTAVGLLGSAIPDLDIGNATGLKTYPEPPVRESTQHNSGVQSTYTESTALVAINQGKAYLPEIRISWWDTVNDIQREAVIPSRKLTIAGAPIAPQPPAPDQITRQPARPKMSGPDHAANGITATEQLNNGNGDSTSTVSGTWKIIALVTSTLWLLTSGILIYLIKNRTLTRISQESAAPQNHLSSKKAMLKALRQKQPNALQQIVIWAQQNSPNSHIESIGDMIQHYSTNSALIEAIREYEKALFSKESNGGVSEQTTEALITQLTALGRPSSRQATQTRPSAKLYPA